jgi:exodeoxyribonuclease VII small subunit
MKPEEEKFEAVITKLEQIVNELEGQIGLEESLKKFDEGMKLAQQADARLKKIENEFHKLQQSFTAPALEIIDQPEAASESETVI